LSVDPELARWNERFGAAGYLFGTAPNAFLAAHKRLLSSGGRALCIADGEGRNSAWLAEQGLDVTAFDFSPVAVEKARRLAAERGVAVRYEVASVYDWRWSEAGFDVVVLLLEGYTPRQLEYRTGGPPHRENLYTEALLREAFSALEILELREYDAEVAEGSGHRGRSALIDLVARKRG
jgi:SAM-dependent methyltransferase